MNYYLLTTEKTIKQWIYKYEGHEYDVLLCDLLLLCLTYQYAVHKLLSADVLISIMPGCSCVINYSKWLLYTQNSPAQIHQWIKRSFDSVRSMNYIHSASSFLLRFVSPPVIAVSCRGHTRLATVHPQAFVLPNWNFD